MTRARTASYGVVTPPPLKLLLQAVLMLCVSLVQGVATTLGVIFKRTHRDWHTDRTHEDLPQATYANHLKEHTNTHRVILGLAPGISGGPSRGPAVDPLETHNRDSRHKAQNDAFAGPTIQAPSLSFRTHAQRASRNPGAAHNPVHTAPGFPLALARVGHDNVSMWEFSAPLVARARTPNPAAPRRRSRTRVRNPAEARSHRTVRVPASSQADCCCR
jgi:hypothetical protein